MPNIRSKIKNHTKKTLHPNPTEPHKLCYCLVKENCQMNGSCLTSSVLYQAYSDNKYKQKKYKGICETTFKKRYENHKNQSA